MNSFVESAVPFVPSFVVANVASSKPGVSPVTATNGPLSNASNPTLAVVKLSDHSRLAASPRCACFAKTYTA